MILFPEMVFGLSVRNQYEKKLCLADDIRGDRIYYIYLSLQIPIIRCRTVRSTDKLEETVTQRSIFVDIFVEKCHLSAGISN